jgi:formamidopyrimidine-DNA glycosylase
MPELPEVETTRVGLLPKLVGRHIQRVAVRDARLRWPIPANLGAALKGRLVRNVLRRGKYLIWDVGSDKQGGFLLCHLGMSGSMFAVSAGLAPGKHDHVDFLLDDESAIRFHDPRRFGAILWIPGPTPTHPLLDNLGPEPLGQEFSGEHLFRLSRGRSISVKEFTMNAQIVVGVGNIYASESLFAAGIRPTIAAGRISRSRYDALAGSIRQTLSNAISAGGSSLRDYVQADGQFGYFQLKAMVYGRGGKDCRRCEATIRVIRQGQRSTFYCPRCQT